MTNMVETFLGPNLDHPILDRGELNAPDENLKNIIKDIVAKIGRGIKTGFGCLKKAATYLARQWAEGARIHAQVAMRSRGASPYYYYRHFC